MSQGSELENLARYIICASFSEDRMIYIREAGQIIYKSKDGKEAKFFKTLF